jgi:hypothetical protein
MAAVTITVLRLIYAALEKLGYMLESLSIPHYSPQKGSDNMLGADDQQERLARARILRDYTPGTFEEGEDIVRAAWRHAEVGRNDQSIDTS